MDELLALIAAVGEDEDIHIRFTEVRWSGTSLQMHLAVSILDSEDDSGPTLWEVRREDVLVYVLRSEYANDLELSDDHPSLWNFKHEIASAFFYNAPVNAEAAVGALYEAHQKTVGSWITFGEHLNTSLGLSQLLAAGNGLLAAGPMPLLMLYKETLRSHGVGVDIRFAHPPKVWNGDHWRELERGNSNKALILGTSYVIGSEWSAQQKS